MAGIFRQDYRYVMPGAKVPELQALKNWSRWSGPAPRGASSNFIPPLAGRRPAPKTFGVALPIKTGANGRVRTDDLRFTKPLLYRLSYVGFGFAFQPPLNVHMAFLLFQCSFGPASICQRIKSFPPFHRHRQHACCRAHVAICVLTKPPQQLIRRCDIGTPIPRRLQHIHVRTHRASPPHASADDLPRRFSGLLYG